MTTRVTDILRTPDTHANRPAANAVPSGALYQCTTHNTIDRSDGTNWATWAYVAPVGTTDADVLTWDTAAGKWKSAAPGGASSSPRTRIADVTLAAVAASFDFTSIPATYDDLEIVFEGRHATNSIATGVNVSLNNDTTDANYFRAFHYWNSGGDGTVATASRGILEVSGAGNTKCLGRVFIPSYTGTTMNKAMLASNTEGGGSTGSAIGAEWKSTAAVNRITLALADAGNFAVGTRCRLYGLKDV